MHGQFSKILFCGLMLLPFIACKKNAQFSDKPFLEYKAYRFVNSQDTTTNRRSIEFTIYFTDGDGDLGSDDEPKDSCDTSINNFFIRYFEKVGTNFVEVQPRDSCLPFDSRIPDITPGGSNPVLEGDIITFFDYSGFPANTDVDSIRFEFKAIDRAGNESNVSVTPSIPAPGR